MGVCEGAIVGDTVGIGRVGYFVGNTVGETEIISDFVGESVIKILGAVVGLFVGENESMQVIITLN